MKKFFLLSGIAISFFVSSYAQSVAIKNDALPPANSAMLDIRNPHKGLLIPRVALTGTTDVITIPSPDTSLLVFNTATNGAGTTAVTPGYYYWNGAAWLLLNTGTSSGSSWLLAGNAGTNASINFLGTTDNNSLQFKANNVRTGYIGVPTEGGNIFWGYQGGLNNKGYSNVGLGSRTLFANSTGSNLVAIGDSALFSNTLGTENTAIGSKAIYSNTNGHHNTAVGYNALIASINASYNIAVGAYSLQSNTGGNFNTAIGTYSLNSNTTGQSNSALGSYALYSNASGISNTAVGNGTLFENSTGEYNTANGVSALSRNNIGTSNTAIGAFSLYSNTTGYSNVVVGIHAARNSESVSNLVAVGDSSLFNNITGAENTALGSKALYSNSTGAGNTATGDSALSSNTTGNNNTALGNQADVSAGNLSNATAIGSGAIVNASNKVRIGNAAVTVIEGQVAYSFPSDARFKYDIQSNVPGLDFIKKLTPVTYYFDEKKLTDYTNTGILNNSTIHAVSYNGPKQLHTGFLAQEVEKVASQLGYSFDGVHAPANEKDHYSLAYSQFIMPLVKSVQEQQQVIEDQSKKINCQAIEIANMNEKIKALAKAIEALTHP